MFRRLPNLSCFCFRFNYATFEPGANGVVVLPFLTVMPNTAHMLEVAIVAPRWWKPLNVAFFPQCVICVNAFYGRARGGSLWNAGKPDAFTIP